jgi:NF-X1-type zinc finger protein NFXL1
VLGRRAVRARCHFGPCPPCPHACGTTLPCGHACSSSGCHDARPPPVPRFERPQPPRAPGLEPVRPAAPRRAADAAPPGVQARCRGQAPLGCARPSVIALLGNHVQRAPPALGSAPPRMCRGRVRSRAYMRTTCSLHSCRRNPRDLWASSALIAASMGGLRCRLGGHEACGGTRVTRGAARAQVALAFEAAVSSAGRSACPPCETLVPVPCLGGHEEMALACCDCAPRACGRQCGRRLACGNHECGLPCHTVSAGDLRRDCDPTRSRGAAAAMSCQGAR